ncbi:MAG: hypothetical protein J1F36_03220 [Clostridiales bacterium]|nr:hypothetical protein [Clostridiales bacterium]
MSGKNYSALRSALKKEREKVIELSEEITKLNSDDKLYELVKDNPNIKNRIISEYLLSLSSAQNPPLSSAGFAPLTPVHRPKNLADAKRLADKIIKS